MLKLNKATMKLPSVLFLLLATVLAAGLGFRALTEMSGHANRPSETPEKSDTTVQAPAPMTDEAPISRDTVKPDMEPASKNSQNLVQEASPWDQLRNGDFWELMSEHWRNAEKGGADSQLIVHSIMSSCATYRNRFEGKHLAEVQAEFSGFNDPDLFILNAEVWDRCGKIYESWDRFDGWKEMREAAAYNGQPVAMVWKGGTLVSNPETFDEGIGWLESALASGDESAVAMMSEVYSEAYVDKDLEAAWLLAACRLGLDCSVVAESCGDVFTACGIQESVRDVIVRELGDHGYYVANQQAERIYDAIASGDVESLDIAADLRK